LSDDDEETEVKLNEKIPEKDNEEEEVDIGGMLSFHGNIYTEEQINNVTNDITTPVDLIQLVKTNLQQIDFDTKVDNSIVVDNFLIELDTMIDFSNGISYNVESLAYFVKNMSQPHPVYIKKVSASNPNIRLVHMDHRKVLIDAFSSENFDKMENLQILSYEAKIQRLLKQFKRIFSRMKTIQGSLPQTKYTDFQPLFEKYFMSIYLSGFKCQENWLEVSRVAAEELVNCWLSADFQYTHLLRNMATLRARHRLNEKKKKEKYRKLFRYFYDELVQNIDKMPLALNLKLFVKNTIEIMDELVRLNKIWETDNICTEKDDDDQNASDIELIEPEKKEVDNVYLSSDEEIQNDKEIIKKLKVLNETQDLNDMNVEDLQNKISNLKEQLNKEEVEHDADDEDDANIKAPCVGFDVEKIKELTAFVSDCVTNDTLDKSSTDDEGKFSDGDDDDEKNESEEILKTFVKEINEEREMENPMESDEEGHL